jgi:hypothetical protein
MEQNAASPNQMISGIDSAIDLSQPGADGLVFYMPVYYWLSMKNVT